MALSAQPPHRVVTLAYDRLWPFEFGIAVEIFGWARPEIGVEWYDFRVAGPASPVRTLGGITLTPDHGYEIVAEADTVSEMVPDGVMDVGVGMGVAEGVAEAHGA